MFRLDNKTAVVTGAGSGIGAAIAETFVRQGARVFVLERDESAGAFTVKRIAAGGGRADSSPATSPTPPPSRPPSTQSNGRRPPRHPRQQRWFAHIGTVETTDEADLDRIYAVNVKGVYLCSRAGVRQMLQNDGGVISISPRSPR